jgi:outer membrane protein assembly factor BamB
MIVAPVDAGQASPPCAPSVGETCGTNLPLQGRPEPQVQIPAAVPSAIGGDPPAGTYVLEASRRYTGVEGAAGPTGNTEQQTLLLSGTGSNRQVEIVRAKAGCALERETLAIALGGTTWRSTLTCPKSSGETTLGYSWDGATLTLFEGALARIFRPTTFPPSASIAEEWPHWRGPRGDGISREAGLVQAWPEKGLRKAWSAPVGEGFSSPVAVEDQIFLFHQKNGAEYLTDFDAKTGRIRWNQSDKGGWSGERPGPRATPSIEGEFIYTYGGVGDLTARLRKTGQRVWRTNILEKVGAKPLLYGVGSSPLVSGDRLYVQTAQGGPIGVAVDRKTGNLVWQSEERGIAGYAPPVLVDVKGTPQLIFGISQKVVAVQPDTGRTIWSVSFPMEEDVHATTPTYGAGHLLVSAAYHAGSMLLALEPTSASVLWRTPQVHMRISAGVYEGGYLYVSNGGVLTCVEWATGRVVWAAEDRELRLGDGGSLVRVADRLVTLSDRGVLTLLQATPGGYSKLAQFEAAKGWLNFATPLLYRNRLFVRSEDALTAWELP